MSQQPHKQNPNQEQHKNNESSKNPVQSEEVPLTEEEMRRQEQEDDQDLNELKLKLKKLEERQPPKDKDELIDHLMERLEQAEQAIFAAEEVITHERKNRKLISSELKAKNMELRKLVEKEKRSLQDKVHDQLEITLQQALKEKMLAEKSLGEMKRLMVERNMRIEEVDLMFLDLREQNRYNEKLTTDQQKIIENIEEELQSTKQERDYLQNLSEERQRTIEKLNTDLDDAHGVITKLEEARIVLNKLLGPNGVITEREREKYLKNMPADNGNYEAGQSQGGTYGQNRIVQDGIKGIVGQSNKMLTQNNQYFYDKQGNQKPKQAVNQYGGANTLMDDANEDEFWYQAPKGEGGPSVGTSGQYNQGYVNNQPAGVNSRTGSRRNGSIVQGNRY